MLCRNEHGVLSGSDYFLPTISDHARQLYYYTTSCGHYFCEPGYCIDRIDAQSYLLMAVMQGELAIETSGKHLIAKAGETVLLDCYSPHKYYALSKLEFLWIHVAGANSRSLCSAITDGAGAIITKQQFQEISRKLQNLLLAFRRQQQIPESMCTRTIYDLLCFLMPDREGLINSEDGLSPVDRAITYIQSRLNEPVSLGEIAAHVQISPYHFVRVFKKATGYSPYDYLILLRINHAKYLLKNTQLSIREIGTQVGYHSEVSFINIFSQKVGISPGRFRKLKIG